MYVRTYIIVTIKSKGNKNNTIILDKITSLSNKYVKGYISVRQFKVFQLVMD